MQLLANSRFVVPESPCCSNSRSAPSKQWQNTKGGRDSPTTVSPGIRSKSQTLIVPAAQPSSRAHAPIMRSPKGRLSLEQRVRRQREQRSPLSLRLGDGWAESFSIVEEQPSLVPSFRRVGSIDAVADLSDCKRAQIYWEFANPTLNGLNRLIRSQLSAFCSAQNAGVENYSQEGGFHR